MTRLSQSPRQSAAARQSNYSSAIKDAAAKPKEDSHMVMQRLISQGEVDYASWRKRKQQRLEREQARAGMSTVGGLAPSSLSNPKNQKSKRSQKFDYVDPVDDEVRREKNASMASLSQMKFHEMKVEREPFENLHNAKKASIQ